MRIWSTSRSSTPKAAAAAAAATNSTMKSPSYTLLSSPFSSPSARRVNSIANNNNNNNTSMLSLRPMLLLIGGILLLLLLVQVNVLRTSITPRNMMSVPFAPPKSSPVFSNSINSLNHLRMNHHHHHQPQQSNNVPSESNKAMIPQNPQQQTQSQSSQCRFYLAESAIPNSGLGIFTAVGLHPGDVYLPDICVYVNDLPNNVHDWMHLRTHTFGRGSFFGQHEGQISRAACEGMITNFNTVPKRLINSKIVSGVLPTHAGLHRATSPGAGAITHHYGIHGIANDIITAGSELTIDYGDWDFTEEQTRNFQRSLTSLVFARRCRFVLALRKPERSVDWLREHGWCIDNIEIWPATDPTMGRGAFARYPLQQGQVVAPLPLQVFANRNVFAVPTTDSSSNRTQEQLLVNYCFQPKHSNMIFFPYGQGAGLINHDSMKANVKLQWSNSSKHHSEWLDLSIDDFWKVAYPGGLILEVVTKRDIMPGEELFLDYGLEWEQAWNHHVSQWNPPLDSSEYMYPADMDETLLLRTVDEQVNNPYPNNLMTMCVTPDWTDRSNGRTIKWYETKWNWWLSMTYCHILDRYDGPNGDPMYTVSLLFGRPTNNDSFFQYDPTIPRELLYLDTHVPRRAIRFVEKPYADDEHLLHAFRHPMEFPSDLVPPSWLNQLDNNEQREQERDQVE